MEQQPHGSLVPLACAAGAGALVGQSVLVRELMVSFYGTELALAAALCSWLLFVPVGALAGAALLKVLRRGRLLAYVGLGAIAVGLPVQLLLARLVRPLLGAEAGEFLSPASMIVGSVVAAFPVAFPVGFFFPSAARFEEQRVAVPGGGISRIYIAEAVGSAIAGALLSFYLLGRLAPAGLVFGTSVILLLLAACRAFGAGGGLCAVVGAVLAFLLCWSAARTQAGLFFVAAALLAAAGCALAVAVPLRRRPHRVIWAACVALGLAICVGFLGWGEKLSQATAGARWATFSPFRLLEGVDTRYQHVEVGERGGEYVLVQNGRRTSQFPDPAAARGQAALLLTQHPGPRDVLVMGGGLGGLCQQMLEGPLRALDYVEPDPQLVALLHRHLPAELRGPLADPRFAAYKYDGRHFVQRCAEEPDALAGGCLSMAEGDAAVRVGGRPPAGAYDLVVINVADPTSASDSRFYTAEFFGELVRILKPGGSVALCGITSSENYVRGEAVLDYTACIYRTLRSAFPWVIVRPGDEFCFFASGRPGVVSSDPGVLMARFDALGLGPRALRYGFELAEFPPERVEWVTGLLEEAWPSALLNSDVRPLVFTLFLRVQAHYARRQVGAPRGAGGAVGADAFGRVRSARPVWFWAPFGALLLPLVLLRAAVGRRRAAPWTCGLAILTTGMFGMSAQMLIVYGYQTSFGYVYRDISVIVGLFMLGLALGGWVMNRLAPARPHALLLVVEAGQAVLILALPLFGGLLSFSPYAFILLSPAAGFLTGSVFPLASRISVAQGRESGTVAGAFDAADHLGGLAGAALAGLLMVPALGVVQSAALLALIKCVSLVGLLVGFAWPQRGAARAGASTT